MTTPADAAERARIDTPTYEYPARPWHRAARAALAATAFLVVLAGVLSLLDIDQAVLPALIPAVPLMLAAAALGIRAEAIDSRHLVAEEVDDVDR